LRDIMLTLELIDFIRNTMDDPAFGLIDPLDIGRWTDPLRGLNPDMVRLAWGLDLDVAQSLFSEDMVRNLSPLSVVTDVFQASIEPAEVLQAYGQIGVQRTNWVAQGYTMSSVPDRTGFEFLRDWFDGLP